jgi:hypothetical protein
LHVARQNSGVVRDGLLAGREEHEAVG